MRIAMLTGLVALSVLTAGCATTAKPGADNSQGGMISAMRTACLDKAHAAYAARQYNAALLEYRKVLDHSRSEEERQQARLGLARTCLQIGSPAAAIARIKVDPDGPMDDGDRELLALLGEALLREERLEEAAQALTLALEEPEGNGAPHPWKAACRANLACARLKNGKAAEAAEMYTQAALAYEQCGRLREAKRARAMAERLHGLLASSAMMAPATPQKIEP